MALRIAASDSSRLSQLIAISSLSHDLIIKLETLNIAKKQLSNQALYNFLCDYLKDKSAVIRRKCIYIFLDKFSEKINPILINTLFDKSLRLRELARFYLEQNEIQSVKIYKNALINRERPLHITIMGLAETGHKDDFNLIEPHLNDSELEIKYASVYAIF